MASQNLPSPSPAISTGNLSVNQVAKCFNCDQPESAHQDGWCVINGVKTYLQFRPVHQGTTVNNLLELVTLSLEQENSNPAPSTATNLTRFSQAVADLELEDRQAFVHYFVGAISTAAPKNDWLRAIRTAAHLLAAGRKEIS